MNYWLELALGILFYVTFGITSIVSSIRIVRTRREIQEIRARGARLDFESEFFRWACDYSEKQPGVCAFCLCTSYYAARGVPPIVPLATDHGCQLQRPRPGIWLVREGRA